MKIIKYIFNVIVFVLLFSVFGVCKSYAVDVISRDEIGIDESLSEDINIFSAPQKIYITQVEGFYKGLEDNPQEWIQHMYYYCVTRLNLNDIPYNFLIDSSGDIYEGARGGIGVNPELEGGENVVLIGILSDSGTLPPRLASSLQEFVEDLSYKYGIKGDTWQFVNLKINKPDTGFSYLVAEPSQKALLSPLKAALEEIQWSSTEHLSYKSKIVSVEYAKEVVIGEMLNVKVTIENVNDFTWFSQPNQIYISTKDSIESRHAINSVWESFSKPTHIQEEVIKPGGKVEVGFNLIAKSRPDTYKESFFLMKSSEIVFEESNFDVDFNIVKGDKKVVELVSPEYGFVNIRECRWYSCEKVEVANEGDVFVTTSLVDGWYEIIYGDNLRGWVYQKYAREI